VLGREEIRALALGEYDFELSADTLERIWTTLRPETARGLPFAQFSRLQTALGIAREQEQARQKQDQAMRLRGDMQRQQGFEARCGTSADVSAEVGKHMQAPQALPTSGVSGRVLPPPMVPPPPFGASFPPPPPPQPMPAHMFAMAQGVMQAQATAQVQSLGRPSQ